MARVKRRGVNRDKLIPSTCLTPVQGSKEVEKLKFVCSDFSIDKQKKMTSWVDVLPLHPIVGEISPTSMRSAHTGWVNGYLPALANASRSAIGTTKTRLRGDVPALHADDPAAVVRSHQLMAMRGADLLVWLPSAEGGGLRAVNLLQLQRRCAASEIGPDALPQWVASGKADLAYKPLLTPQIEFEPRRLLLHPSGDYLAVLGDRSLAVVLLPKAMAMRTTHAVECKSIAVGPYIHPPDLTNTIAHVAWHPLSEDGKDLCVLTSDGTLRLYHLSRSPQTPEQVCVVTPESDPLGRITASPSRAPNRAPAEEAVAFAFGSGSADPWGPLTAHVLFRNGDVYTVCPFMPKKRFLLLSLL